MSNRTMVGLVVALFALGLIAQGASAQTAVVWDGDTSTTFSDGQNWVGGTAPTDDLTTDYGLFTGDPGGITYKPDLTADRQIAGLVFNTAGWTIFNVDPNPNPVYTLTLGAVGIDSYGAGTNILGPYANLSLGATSSWTIGTGNTLRIDGVISGANNLNKYGPGELRLTGSNTNNGQLNVYGGTVRLVDAGTATSVSSVSISNGSLILDNTGTTDSSDRLNNLAFVNLSVGNLSFLGAADTASAETLAAVTLNLGFSTINSTAGSGTGTATLTLSSLSRTTANRPGVNFTGSGLGGASNKIMIDGQADGFMGGWAIVNGADFAKYDSTGATGVLALSGGDYETGGQSTWDNTKNALVTGGVTETLGGDRELNSLKIAGASANTVAIGGNTLNIYSGGILAVDGDHSITGTGKLTAGGTDVADLTVTVGDIGGTARNLTISAPIGNNAAATIRLVKNGPGTLTLTGSNTFGDTGDSVWINGGVISITSNAALGVVGADIVLSGGGTLQTSGVADLGPAVSTDVVRYITVNDGGGAIDVQSGNLVVYGGLSGSGALSKIGPATLTVNAWATYNSVNGFNLVEGTLRLANNRSLGNGLVSLGTATITASGTGTYYIHDSNGVPAPISLDGNTTFGASAGDTGALLIEGAATLTGDRTLTVLNTTTLSGNLTGAYNLSKAGAGTLVLGGTGSDFGGSGKVITVTNGYLSVSADVNLGDSNNSITLDAGGLLATETFSSSRAVALGAGGGTVDVTATKVLTLGGVVSGSGNPLTKVGNGTLVLTASNTFDGKVTVSAGALRAAGVDALGGSGGTPGNLVLGTGAVLELGTGNYSFTRNLGTAANEVDIIGGGGFAAVGGAGTVNLSGTGGQVTWGVGQFVASGKSLLFGSVNADNKVDFQNDIALGSLTRTISVNDNAGSAADYAEISGDISGAGGLTKAGLGVLVLSGSNTWGGATTVSAGTLRSGSATALPAGTDLIINGGTVDVFGTSPTIGTLSFTAGGLLTNTDTANPSTVTLGGNVSVSYALAQASISPGASASLTLDMGATKRTFSVADGTAADDLYISAVLAGTAGLSKTGNGVLVLDASNTFTGGMDVLTGTVKGVAQAAGNPFNDNAATLKTKGVLALLGLASTDTDVGVGATTFYGANSLSVTNVTGGNTTTLTLASLTRSGKASLMVLGATGLGSNELVKVTSGAPTSTNGMVPGYYLGMATGGAIHLDYTTAGFINATYETTTLSGALTTDKVDLAANEAISANQEVYAVRTASNITVSGTANPVLTLGSGSLILNSDVTIAPGVKFGSAGTAEGLVYVASGKRAMISGPLTTTGGLTKFGPGVLLLSGDNATASLSGGTVISDGQLRASQNANLGVDGSSVTMAGGTLGIDLSFMTPRALAVGASGGTLDVVKEQLLWHSGSLTGSDPLVKTGMGNLALAGSGNTFSGSFEISSRGAAPGGYIPTWTSLGQVTLIRDAVLNPSSITVGYNTTLMLDNRLGQVDNRIGDSVPIQLNGGVLNIQANSSPGETLGTVTLGPGRSQIQTGTGGRLNITTLDRTGDGAEVSFSGSSIFVGSQADNTTFPGWARFGTSDWARYTTAGGVAVATYDTSNNEANWTAGVNPTVTANVNLTANRTPWSLKFTSSVTVNLDATGMGGPHTLNLEGGGIISTTTAPIITGGTLTAGGTATSGVVPLALYGTTSSSTTQAIRSTIADNGYGAALQVLMYCDYVSGQGQWTLDNTVGDNTYSGGTVVVQGRLVTGNVANRRYLGTGPASVLAGGRLLLGNVGASSYTAGPTYTAEELGDITLPNVSYAASTETFYIKGDGVGGILTGSSTPLSSLDRDRDGFAGAGDTGNVVLERGAIIAHSTDSTTTIADLGTDADLIFGLNVTFNQSLTVGSGTPWMGLSNTVRNSRTYGAGTITANSAFKVQGISGYTLTLGGVNIAASGSPVDVDVLGNVTLSSGSADYSGVNRFLVNEGAILTISASAAQRGRPVEVFGGGRLTVSHSTALDGAVAIGAGGQLDIAAAGLSGSGTITRQPGSILILSNATPFAGAQLTAGSVSAGDILRVNTNITDGVHGANAGAVYEIYGGNRSISSTVSGISLARDAGLPADAASGMLTNDLLARTMSAANMSGTIVVPSAGILVPASKTGTFAATYGADLTVDEEFDLGADATLQIGFNGVVDGALKLGNVSVRAADNSNTGASGSKISIISGVTLNVPNYNTIPNLTGVEVASGATFALASNRADIIGSLAGAGNVTVGWSDGYSTGALIIGADNSDTTFSGVISGSGGIGKLGTGTLTLTGTSTFTGYTGATYGQNYTATVIGGTLRLYQGGKLTAVGPWVREGGTFILDDTGTNMTDRLTVTSRLAGGEFKLLGNASADTTEVSTGTLELRPGASELTVVPGSGYGASMTFATLSRTQAGGNPPLGTLVVRGTNLGAAAYPTADTANVYFTTAPTLLGVGTGAEGTPGVKILPYVLADTSASGAGIGFATYNAIVGVRPLTSAEYDTSLVANSNVKLDGVTPSMSADMAISSLTLANGAGINSIGLTRSLTIGQYNTQAGLLVASGASVLNTNISSNGGEMDVFVQSGASLTVNATISGGSFAKSGPGTMVLNGTVNAGGYNAINEGTVEMGANGVWNTGRLFINSGTWDLKGTNQTLNSLHSTGPEPWYNSSWQVGGLVGVGGTVTNTSTTASTLRLRYSTYGGTPGGNSAVNIAGNVNVEYMTTYSQGGFTSFGQASSYTGTTTISGASLTLVNEATLPTTGSAAVNIYYGRLLLENRGTSYVDNRVSDSAPLTLRAALLSFTGRGSTAATETLGNITLDSGGSWLLLTPYQNGSAEVTLGTITRTGNDSLLYIRTGAGTLGAAGVGNSRVLISGQSATTFLPPYLVYGGFDYTAGGPGGWLKYDTTLGVQQLVTLDYNTGAETTWTSSTQNVRPTAAVTLTANREVNSLMTGWTTSGQGITLGTYNLNIVSGGIITTGGNTALRPIAGTTGRLTAGGTSTAGSTLYFYGTRDYNGPNITEVSANITNNPGPDATYGTGDDGMVGLLVGGPGTVRLAGTGNTYTGVTSVLGGLLTFPASLPTVSASYVPGELNIVGYSDAGGLVTLTANETATASQISKTAKVTLKGPSRLNLNNFTQTLADVDMVSNGGWAGPTITSGTGIFKLTGTIDVNNVMGVEMATITGLLQLDGTGNRTIDVDGSGSVTGLQISAVISSGTGEAITKVGTGRLELTASNTFIGTVAVQNGVLQVSADSRLGNAANTITLGTASTAGTLRTSLSSSQAFARSISLAVGGGVLENPSNTATFSQDITGTGSLTVRGGGGFVLSATNNNYSGGLTLIGSTLSVSHISGWGTGNITFVGPCNPINTTGGIITLANSVFFSGGRVTLGTIWSTSDAFIFSSTATLTADTEIYTQRGYGRNSDVTFNASIVDSPAGRSLTLNGTGYSWLNANNTFTGTLSVVGGVTVLNGSNTPSATYLDGGSLHLGTDTAITTGTVNLVSGRLRSATGDTRQVSRPISLNGNITLGESGSGNLVFNNPVTLTGDRTVTVDTIQATFANTVSGGYKLTKAGGGTMILTASNAYSGGTVMSAGSIFVGHDSALGSGTASLVAGTLASLDVSTRTLANALSFDGNVTLGGGGGGALVLNGSGPLTGNRTLTISGEVTLAGLISQDTAGRQMIKAGSGTLTISGTAGANTFSGGFVMNAGTVRVGKAGAFGDTAGTLSLVAGTMTSDGATARSVGNVLSIDGNVTLGDLIYSGDLNYTGLASLTADRTLTVNSKVTLSNVLGGAFSLSKGGPGILVLSGSNTFGTSGKTVTVTAGYVSVGQDYHLGNTANKISLNGGGLMATNDFTTQRVLEILGGGGSVFVDSTKTFTFGIGTSGGTLQGSGTLTKTGPGTMVLDPMTSTFSGTYAINNGLLLGLGWDTPDTRPFNERPVVMTGAGQLGLLGWDSYNSEVGNSGATTDTVSFAGGNVIGVDNFSSTNTAYTYLHVQSLSRAARGTLIVRGVQGSLGVNERLIDDSAGLVVTNGMVPAYIVVEGSPAKHATYDTSGTPAVGLIAATYETTSFSGALTTDKVDLAAAEAPGNQEVYALRTNQNVTGSNTLSLGSGGLIVNEDVSLAANLRFGSAGTGEALAYVTGGKTATASGQLITTAGLTKFGNGTLLLTGANSGLGGGVVLNGGVLQLGNASAIPAANALTVNSGTFNLSGYDQQVASLDGILTGTVTNSGAAKTLTVAGGGTYGGVIAGTVNLLKTSTGTLYLTGTTTSSGTITVGNGTLRVDSFFALNTDAAGGVVTVQSGATLQHTLSIARSLTIEAGGRYSPFTGNSMYSNIGNITLSGPGDCYMSTAADYNQHGYLSGQITGNGRLVVDTGVATIHLTNANNTFSGGVLVSGGMLSADSMKALGTGAVVVTAGNPNSDGLGLRLRSDLAASGSGGPSSITVQAGGEVSLNLSTPAKVTYPITLNGGWMWMGGNRGGEGSSHRNTQYDGVLTLTADSFLGNNGSSGGMQLFSGQITGAYKLYIDRNYANAAAQGIALSNTANAAWTGGLIINHGLVEIRGAGAAGGGNVTLGGLPTGYSPGGVLYRSPTGSILQTTVNGALTPSGTVTINEAAVYDVRSTETKLVTVMPFGSVMRSSGSSPITYSGGSQNVQLYNGAIVHTSAPAPTYAEVTGLPGSGFGVYRGYDNTALSGSYDLGDDGSANVWRGLASLIRPVYYGVTPTCTLTGTAKDVSLSQGGFSFYAWPGAVMNIGTAANLVASDGTSPVGLLETYGSGTLGISGVATVLPTVIDHKGSQWFVVSASGGLKASSTLNISNGYLDVNVADAFAGGSEVNVKSGTAFKVDQVVSSGAINIKSGAAVYVNSSSPLLGAATWTFDEGSQVRMGPDTGYDSNTITFANVPATDGKASFVLSQNVELTGNLYLGDNTRITTGTDWTGASVSSTISAASAGQIQLAGGSTKGRLAAQDSVRLTVDSVINVGGNELLIGNTGSFTVLGGRLPTTHAPPQFANLMGYYSIGQAGTVRLSNTGNILTGNVTVVAGTLEAHATGALGTATVNLGTATGGNVNLMISLAGVSVDNAIVVAAGTGTRTLGSSVSGATTYGVAGSITLNKDLDVTAVSGGTVTIDGTITGSANLTKIGNGTVVLTSTASDFVGLVSVNLGALRVADNASLGDTGNDLVLGTGSASGTLGAAAASVTLGTGRSVTLSAGGSILDAGVGNVLQLDGVISGAALTKSANGTVVLTGSNLYSGGTTVNGGTLRLGHNDALGTGTLNIAASSTLTAADTTARTAPNAVTVNAALNLLADATYGDLYLGGVVSGSGAVTKTGSGTAAFSGTSNLYTGNVNIQVGTFGIGSIGGTGTIGISAGATLLGMETLSTSRTVNVTSGNIEVAAGKTMTLAGALNVTTGFTKTGSGTLVISGSQTYSSTVDVNNGTLRLNSNANSTALTLNVNGSAALEVNSHQNMGALNVGTAVDDTATATILTGGSAKTIKTNALGIAMGSGGAYSGIMDINEHRMVIDYTGASPITTIEQMTKDGFYSGSGLISTYATLDPTGLLGAWAYDNGDPNAIVKSSPWGGQTIDDTSILIRMTWYGDMDFNGTVDSEDYSIIDTVYLDPGSFNLLWQFGDLDFDDDVDSEDYSIIDTVYLGQGSPLGDFFAGGSQFGGKTLAVTPVPEPATLAFLALGGLAIAGTAVARRRRRAA